MLLLLPTALAGTLALSPDTLPVHDKATQVITWTATGDGLSTGDSLRLYDPLFHGIRWAKWGHLTTDPSTCEPLKEGPLVSSAGVVTANTSTAGVTLSLWRNTEAAGLHSVGFTEVTIASGSLAPGESVRVLVGDTTAGLDCGLQTSLRSLRDVTWTAEEIVGGVSTDLDPVTFDFVTERDPARVLVSLPSQALVGEPVTAIVAVLDDLGNPTPRFSGTVTVAGEDLAYQASDEGVRTVELSWDSAGVQRPAVDADGLTAVVNPVEVFDLAPDLGIYWGDLHTHHGLSYTDEAGFTHDQNHEYGRDVAGLQYGCETVKASPHELEWETLWAELQETCETHTDDRYVAILGFEWMGSENSPLTEGHHNVYYDGCDGPLAPNTTTGLTGDDALWTFMLEAEAEHGIRSLSVPHASSHTGFNWLDRDDELRPLAEIYSEWGFSDAHTDDGSGVYDALAAGHRMGIFAASDNHDGWLGNRWAEYYETGGLGAIAATDLSREGLFEGLEARSTYGTTGHRPILRFTGSQDGAGFGMGAEAVVAAPVLHWTYRAEGSIDTVTLWSVPVDGSAPAEVVQTWQPGAADAEGEHALDWDQADRALWLHVTEGSGHQAWSSPVWVTSDCERAGAVDPAGLCDPDTVDTGDSGGADSGGTGDSGGTAPVDSGGPGDSGDGEGRCGCQHGGGVMWLLAPVGLWFRRRWG